MCEKTAGEVIGDLKEVLKQNALAAVEEFEERSGVTVQSVHCYLTEPDPKLLNDKGKQRVDIILKL